MDPPEQPSAQELPDPWGELSAPAVSKMQSGIRILDPWQFDFVSQDQNRSGYIYVVQDIESKLYKIGRTQNMGRRMQQLGVGKTALLCSIKPPGGKSGRDGEASTFLAEGGAGLSAFTPIEGTRLSNDIF